MIFCCGDNTQVTTPGSPQTWTPTPSLSLKNGVSTAWANWKNSTCNCTYIVQTHIVRSSNVLQREALIYWCYWDLGDKRCDRYWGENWEWVSRPQPAILCLPFRSILSPGVLTYTASLSSAFWLVGVKSDQQKVKGNKGKRLRCLIIIFLIIHSPLAVTASFACSHCSSQAVPMLWFHLLLDSGNFPLLLTFTPQGNYSFPLQWDFGYLLFVGVTNPAYTSKKEKKS